MNHYSYNHVPVLNGRVLSSDDEQLSGSWAAEVGIDDHQMNLITMNDGTGKEGDENYQQGKPFSEIADYIDANL